MRANNGTCQIEFVHDIITLKVTVKDKLICQILDSDSMLSLYGVTGMGLLMYTDDFAFFNMMENSEAKKDRGTQGELQEWVEQVMSLEPKFQQGDLLVLEHIQRREHSFL